MLVLLLMLSAFLLQGTAGGQNIKSSKETEPGKETQPAGAAAAPVDPLKRETPYGAITGFLKAAGQKNYNLAASYPQLPRRKPSARDKETAEKLEAILNRGYFASLDRISRDPEGDLGDGLRPDRESIGQARILGGHTLDIELVRLEDPEVGKVWLISSDTLRQVPDFYERMPFTAMQNRVPEWLIPIQFFSLTALGDKWNKGPLFRSEHFPPTLRRI